MIGRVVVVGAGPVGLAMALGLGQRGIEVRVVERRSRDECTSTAASGARTVSLSLSPRGLSALRAVGVDGAVRARSVAMDSRILHFGDGTIDSKTYGAPDRVNHAIARGTLTSTLLDAATEHPSVEVQFDSRCGAVNINAGEVQVWANGSLHTLHADIVVGADGARSAVREALLKRPGFSFSQEFFPAGYMELPLIDEGLSRSAIHIWRGHRPVVGLPALGGGIKGTLVLPVEGPDSFDAIDNPSALVRLLKSVHPNLPLDVASLERTFSSQRFGRLVTIRCNPYSMGRTMLIGDAAHAMCPFMGQGVNAGLEDVGVFLRLLDECPDPPRCLAEYSRLREPEGRAAAELSLWNYKELGGLLPSAEQVPAAPNAPPIVLVNFFPVSYRSVLQVARGLNSHLSSGVA